MRRQTPVTSREDICVMDHKQYAARRRADRIGKTILAVLAVCLVVLIALRMA